MRPCTLCLALLLSPAALAQSLVPGPGAPGYDAALAAKIDGYERQVHGVLTVPLGYGLEAFVTPPANRALIDAFIASGATDFKAQSGKHPYEVLDQYEEMGDLGMFGGVQAAGDAFRYGALRDSGAPAAEVDAARASLLRVMDGLHWAQQITGVPGVVVRGLQRIRSEAGEPPIPGPIPTPVPLFDGQGNPQPADKQPTWRADRSGQLPFLAWFDDCSKDQLDGHVFAMGAVFDVVTGDPTIPADKVARLQEDARALGQSLMKKVQVGPGVFADLVIMDADGRPTTFHDLSAEEFVAGAVSPEALNGFNALMALGAVRTLFHVSGDAELGTWYYDQLAGTRNYYASVVQSAGLMYAGTGTNFSNVNMAFVAAYGVLRYEPDDKLSRRARNILEATLYAPGKDREARGEGQSLFDFIYAGFRTGGATGPGATALSEGLRTLSEAKPAPTWDEPIENCDAAELASRNCIGVDGTPLPISPSPGRGGGPVAVDPVPMRLRPSSNYWWRSDPHKVNGDGSTRLNPSSELATAYWLGRFLQASSSTFNISPHARVKPGTEVVAPPPPEAPKGCGCSSAEALCGLLALLGLRRQSAQQRKPVE